MPTLKSFSVNKLSERGVAHIFLLLVLLAGIAGGIVILKSPENFYSLFRPKAGPGVTVAFVDGSGNPVTSISSASARVKLTSPDWPTTQSIKKVSLVSEALAQTNNFTYIDYQVSCSTPSGLTPDQMCQKKGFAKAVAVSGSNAAKGYWWRQCGGASVSACSGLNCTVNKLDCTNKAGYWGSQQPYRSNYMKGGTAQTVYKPTDLGLSCSGYNPGWTVRVACASAGGVVNPTTIPAPTTKPTSSCSACSADVDKDGLVNIYDFSALRVCFNKKVADAPNCKSADIDGSGTVNLQDFTCLSSQFGKTCTTTSPTPPPAPVTTVGAVLAEDPNFTINVKNVNMATSSATVDYTFSSSAAGTKTLYARFKSSDNREQNASPYPATITLTAPSPTPTSVPTAARVFVTSTTYTGNLGGVSGANAKCQDRANAANLGGTWKAWITGMQQSYSDVYSTFIRSSLPYKLLDGRLVANSWADLTDQTLANPINYTETNQLLSASSTNPYVWSNTSDNGTIWDTQKTCNNWSSDSTTYQGSVGSVLKNNYEWSAVLNNYPNCAAQNRLFCFEQEPGPSTPAARVFITSTDSTGNLGGLSAADGVCQTRANTANLGGTWKAWLSDSTTSASSRLIHSSIPYKLLNNGVVANNWVDLTDGTLQSPIDITENKTSKRGGVWTNTALNGDKGKGSCGDWRFGDNMNSSGQQGDVSSTPLYGKWTDWGATPCGYTASLYCFEQ